MPEMSDERPVLVIPKNIPIANVEAMFGAWNMRVIHQEPLPETMSGEAA